MLPEGSYHVKYIKVIMISLKLPYPWFLNAVEEFEEKWWKMVDDHDGQRTFQLVVGKHGMMGPGVLHA